MITRPSDAEEALLASEARFRTLVQSSWDVVHLVDTTGLILYESPAVLRVLGHRPEDMEGHNIVEFVHPDDLAELMRTTPLDLATPGSQRTVILRVRHADGSWRWIESFEVNLVDNPAVGAIAVNYRDVTERREAEDALRASEERLRASEAKYRLLFQGSPLPMWVYDSETLAFLAVNPTAERRYGYTAAEFLTMTIRDIRPPEDVERLLRAVAARPAGASTEPALWRHVRKDGEQIDVEVSTEAIDFGGRPARLVVAQDVTARLGAERNAEAAQRAVREQAALIDEARDAIIVRDLELRISFWSKGAERVYGWPAADVLGHRVDGILQPDPDTFAIAITSVLAQGQWSGSIQKVASDGRRLTIEGRWTLLRDEHGAPRSVLSIDTDVTERRKLEQQFLRAQRMESIGTLAGGIAHDLNNVLAPIMLSIEMLRRHEQDPKRLRTLATIEASATRGADMVRQVLAFGRGVDGKRIRVAVRHLLQDVAHIANETFLKSIDVHIVAPEGVWAVTGDPTQLHQVLLNLCVNARDAMPLGGTLTLSADNVVLDTQYVGQNADAHAGPHVEIVVEDTGSGMPPAILERIFEPFFTTKEVGKGTGLGLSTSLAIVKSHGGFVRAYSEPGRGSRFRVCLPAYESNEAELTSREVVTLPRGDGELVLVVDDEDSVRVVTQQTLEAFGYRAIVASDDKLRRSAENALSAA